MKRREGWRIEMGEEVCQDLEAEQYACRYITPGRSTILLRQCCELAP